MPFARKRFGQHFLERAWVDKLIQAIAPSGDQTFLEIGPGRGALTIPLAACARRVLAFEIDRDLATGLRATAPGNLTVIDGDFLDVTTDQLRDALQAGADSPPASVRAAGNLPYNVASPILFKLVALHTRRDSAGRCQHHAAAGGRRSAHGNAGHQGIRRPDGPDRPVSKGSSADGAAAWCVSAGAQGPFGGRPPRVPRARTGGQGPRAVRERWFSRSSRGAGKHSPTRSRPSLPARRCPPRRL